MHRPVAPDELGHQAPRLFWQTLSASGQGRRLAECWPPFTAVHTP